MRVPVCCLAIVLNLAAVSHVDAQWLESKSPHYSIFYQSGYEQDVAFVRSVMESAEALMTSKYGVTPEHYRMSVYLHPAATDTADVNHALNRCCTPAAAGVSTGTIDLLAPSAPVWRESNFRSSLGLPKSSGDYHAKILMSEYIPIGHYAVQDTRPSGGWRYYSAPEWFVQGLQEYDAIFHTTDTNRSSTAAKLLEWARSHRDAFSCCSPTLKATDVYNGGAAFMAFLAVQFGEDVHARILRDGAETFEVALANQTKPYSLAELFQRFQTWLTDTTALQRFVPVREIWAGTWTLNLSKSTYEVGSAPRSTVSTIEPAGRGWKASEDVVDAQGVPSHVEIAFGFDGSDYPVSGASNTTWAFITIDDHVYELIVKRNGVVTATARTVVSADGSTRTTTTPAISAQGQPATSVAVYERR